MRPSRSQLPNFDLALVIQEGDQVRACDRIVGTYTLRSVGASGTVASKPWRSRNPFGGLV
jgi:hypothetical protein